MGDEDFITAMNQAVKQEVIKNYLFARRVMEEEINLLDEDAAAWRQRNENWRGSLAGLAALLPGADTAREYFHLAGLGRPPAPDHHRKFAFLTKRIWGLTLGGRYQRLVNQAYAQVYKDHQELTQELEALENLWKEVNRDVAKFELDHDLMSLSAYLRTLDQNELIRQKIMGTNFTYRERRISADQLSFRPVPRQQVFPDQMPPHQITPPERMRQLGHDLLAQTARRETERVRLLITHPGSKA